MKKITKVVFFLFLSLSLFGAKAVLGQISPTKPAQGFDLFVKENAVLSGGHSEGTGAIGGNVTFDYNYSFAHSISGGFEDTNNGESTQVGLYVDGKIVFGSVSGDININSSTYLKIGDDTGIYIHDVMPGNPSQQINTRVNESSSSIDANPKIILNVKQPATSVNRGGLIDFDEAFDLFESYASQMSQITATSTIVEAYGTGKISLQNGLNVINTTGTVLNSLNALQFENGVPSSDKPVIINVDASGAFSTEMFNFNGIGDQQGAFILFNFYNTTDLEFTSNTRTVKGTIYAPLAHFNKQSSSNIDGQVIVKSFAMSGGELHHYVYNNNVVQESTIPTPVVCNTEGYLIQSNDLYTVDLNTGQYQLAKENITPSTINAIGYNVKDGNIWGVLTKESGKIVKIKSDYQAEEFVISGFPSAAYTADVGDIDVNGILYFKRGESKTTYKIDLNPDSATYLDYLGSFNISSNIIHNDWAFNTKDNMLYTVLRSNNHLNRIDPDTGIVTDLGEVPALSGVSDTYGAVYFDTTGDFYVSLNTTGEIFRIRNVDQLNQGDFIISFLFSNGPSSGLNDGARCPNAPGRTGENDADNDGIPDDFDNCVDTANPDQADTDNNGIGDVCEGLVSDCDGEDCKNLNKTFEAYLVRNGYDDVVDGNIIPTVRLDTITTLDLSNMNMRDLSGIEYLTGLKTLHLNGNEFTSIDLSHNLSLEHLNVDDNHLSSIDVSMLVNLKELYAGSNELTSIDVSNNTLLTDLGLKYNQLSSIDVSANSWLTLLEVQYNNLQLNNLILGTNTNLEYLYAQYNNLTSVDVSGVLSLVELYLNDNNLSGKFNLNAHNYLEVISLCNNDLVLTTDCFITRAAPESYDTLEEYLVFIGLDNVVDGVINTSSEIENMTRLDITDKGIKDMSGIELFTSLEELHASGNEFSSIDLSSNTLLKVLDVSNNKLSTLDVSDLTLLEELYAGFNSISSIDLTENLLLTKLNLRENILTTLDVTDNEALVLIEVEGNGLTQLTLGKKEKLEELYAGFNNLTSLDVSQALNLIDLHLQYNSLEGTLDLDKNKCILTLNLSHNSLEKIKFKNEFNSRVPNDGFNIVNNPLLICVKVDQVAFSTAEWTMFVEDASVFSPDDCAAVTASVVKIENKKVVVPEEIDFEIYKSSGNINENKDLQGIYFIRTTDKNSGEVKVEKILIY